MQARGCLWLEAVEPCTVRKALTPRCDGTVKAIEKVRNSQLDLSRICELMSVLDVPRGCNEMTECAMARVSQKRATICLIRRQKVCYTKQSHGRQAGGPLPSQIAYSADASMSEAYWTVSSGKAERTGYSCRECRKVICKGETMKVREGRKLRFYYHEACFSGEADPRTQGNSSFSNKELPISKSAPATKGRGKWSVASYGYQGSE